MIELSNIDSYQETLIHIAYHGCACSFCAQIIQRILCSLGAIRLPAGDIRDALL